MKSYIRNLYVLMLMFSQSFIYGKTVYLVGEPDIIACCFNERRIASKDEATLVYNRIKTDLEAAGYQVKYGGNGANLTDFTAIISFNEANGTLLSNISQYPKERCFLFSFEPPIIHPLLFQPHLTNYYGRIYIMMDDLIDNSRYFKFHYPQYRTV